MTVFPSLLAVAHALAGAVWLGAMCYSLFQLHPRAHAYFKDQKEFETFIATVSHGARWKVLGALAFVAATGVGLLALRGDGPRPLEWWVYLSVKGVLWLAAVALFAHVSWRMWPARLFALPEEAPHFQRRFQRVALVMITLAAASFALGVIMVKTSPTLHLPATAEKNLAEEPCGHPARPEQRRGQRERELHATPNLIRVNSRKAHTGCQEFSGKNRRKTVFIWIHPFTESCPRSILLTANYFPEIAKVVFVCFICRS